MRLKIKFLVWVVCPLFKQAPEGRMHTEKQQRCPSSGSDETPPSHGYSPEQAGKDEPSCTCRQALCISLTHLWEDFSHQPTAHAHFIPGFVGSCSPVCEREHSATPECSKSEVSLFSLPLTKMIAFLHLTDN